MEEENRKEPTVVDSVKAETTEKEQISTNVEADDKTSRPKMLLKLKSMNGINKAMGGVSSKWIITYMGIKSKVEGNLNKRGDSDK
jgi:hypothetical protein